MGRCVVGLFFGGDGGVLGGEGGLIGLFRWL